MIEYWPVLIDWFVSNIVFIIVFGIAFIGFFVFIATAPTHEEYMINAESYLQWHLDRATPMKNEPPIQTIKTDCAEFLKAKSVMRRERMRKMKVIPFPDGVKSVNKNIEPTHIKPDDLSDKSREFYDNLRRTSPTSTPAELARSVIDVDSEVQAATNKYLASLEEIGSTFNSNVFSVMDRLATRRGYRLVVDGKGVFGNYVRFEKLP